MADKKGSIKEFPTIPTLTRPLISILATFILILTILNLGNVTRTPILLGGLLLMLILINSAHLWYVARTRQEISDCIPLEDVCQTLGLDERLARRFAAERGIEPRYNIGGKSLYRIEDFEDADTLLRPARGPEAMLRPSMSSEQPDEVLVRPAEGKE